jgi:hypothetical protein
LRRTGARGRLFVFEEIPEGGSGRGGAGQGGTTGGSSGAGGKAGRGGTGGASSGAGGTVGGVGGSAAGVAGAQGGDGAFGGAGSGQGGAAGSPVGGSAGRADAGQGGGDGGAMACSDPDATGGRGDGSTTESTTTGLNGTFTDSCDEGGNLVEHVCELGSCISARIVPAVGGRGGIPQGGTGGLSNCPTGNVVARTIDCGGRCQDGACFSWCAEQGKSFEITGISEMRVLMTTGDYDYTCDVVFEGEGFDCRSSSLVGRTVVVTSLGACNGESTTFGWNDPESNLAQECTFTCTFQ